MSNHVVYRSGSLQFEIKELYNNLGKVKSFEDVETNL